ncbi:unnamed protein product [Taenia asiatica]|uniref:SH2 domain-containing protein n=1 Tax=Taenia asiatica TaxID=60517 RepID=A0A0R3W456_TAEAS|nr:unnamed protein product [Taenia asiatica]
MITVSQPPLTPTIPRYSLRQSQATFGSESDYETPEKIWLRAQRLSAIRRTESTNLNTPSPRGVSRSHSSVSRTHFDLDATPKASLGAHSEVTPKAQFGVRRRAPPMRVELRTPLCQRKRIQPVKVAEVEAENSTLAEITSKQTGVYELEEPLMAGPSSLLQALKEVKFAEKEQLDRTLQAEPRRITLFDLIAEKERRHRARSPPPVPPKPMRRLATAGAPATMKSAQRSDQSIENSVPKTVDGLKPSTLFQPTTPPSLPSPPRCAMLRKTTGRSDEVSGTAVVIPKRLSEQESKMESAPPLISDNPFVRWDRLNMSPSNKPQQNISSPSQKSTMGDRPPPDTEGLTSPGSSGVGTEAFDDDGFITASASATTPIATSSSSSTTSVNSSSSPSVDWPHPEKITARPQSHQCSPDSFDETHLHPKPKEVNGNSCEVGLVHNPSLIRVSVVAAPKKPLPISDSLPPETASDTATNTTSSSRASTIFSYPWDLPPPQTHQPSSSPPPTVPLKWATLQRHISEMGQSPPPPPLTKTLKQNEYDGEDIPERRSSVTSEEATESLGSMVVHGEGKIEIASKIKEEKTYAIIGDESGAYERVLERLPPVEVPSPKLQHMSTADSTELLQKEPLQQYVYAEVRPSPDTSTSSSTGIRIPPVPAHPSKTNATPLSSDAHFYEVIKGNLTPPEAKKKSSEIHSSTIMSSNSIGRKNQTNGSSGSPSSFSEPGRHLEQFVCRTVSPQTAEEFTNLVKKEYRELPNLSQVPVLRNPIPGQSKDSRDIKKFALYASILALVDLLKPSRALDVKDDSSASTGISRIEVQRLYLEALISPARLASSAEGCKCLTDLVCLLRYVEGFRCYASPAEAIRLLCRQSRQTTEIEASLETMWHPGLNKMRRSYTDNIQEALNRSNDHSMTLSFASPPCQARRVRKIGCVQGLERISAPSTSSFILVLAANEAERLLVPYEIPLRQSLTVRELCNMLALKLQIFDSKEYTLFYHSVGGGEFDTTASFSWVDFAMSDTIHLERFMTQGLDASAQSGNEKIGISSSSSSIDVLATSQPTTPKLSTLRRFFQRRKRLFSSGSLKRESSLSQRQHHRKSAGVIKRQPSIDWSTMGGGDADFVLIYRRRSSEAVLYAHDLFECLPSVKKLI